MFKPGFKHAFVFASLLLVLAVLTSVAYAQGEDPPPTPHPDEVNAIAENLYCPVCENIPLDVCGTAACAQWRQQIADLLTQGYSEQQIYDYFAEQYGDAVLAAPPARGINWVIYILPPAAIFIAAMLLWRSMRTSRATAQTNMAEGTIGKEYIAQLEEDLKSRNNRPQ
jgi:cytochrome c-type biogenesis protein CcmH